MKILLRLKEKKRIKLRILGICIVYWFIINDLYYMYVCLKI